MFPGIEWKDLWSFARGDDLSSAKQQQIDTALRTDPETARTYRLVLDILHGEPADESSESDADSINREALRSYARQLANSRLARIEFGAGAGQGYLHLDTGEAIPLAIERPAPDCLRISGQFPERMTLLSLVTGLPVEATAATRITTDTPLVVPLPNRGSPHEIRPKSRSLDAAELSLAAKALEAATDITANQSHVSVTVDEVSGDLVVDFDEARETIEAAMLLATFTAEIEGGETESWNMPFIARREEAFHDFLHGRVPCWAEFAPESTTSVSVAIRPFNAADWSDFDPTEVHDRVEGFDHGNYLMSRVPNLTNTWEARVLPGQTPLPEQFSDATWLLQIAD